jgi:hypothetical protein
MYGLNADLERNDRMPGHPRTPLDRLLPALRLSTGICKTVNGSRRFSHERPALGPPEQSGRILSVASVRIVVSIVAFLFVRALSIALSATILAITIDLQDARIIGNAYQRVMRARRMFGELCVRNTFP